MFDESNAGVPPASPADVMPPPIATPADAPPLPASGQPSAPAEFGFIPVFKRAFAVWKIQWLKLIGMSLLGALVGSLALLLPLVLYTVSSFMLNSAVTASVEDASSGILGLAPSPPGYLMVMRLVAGLLGVVGIIVAIFIQLRYGLAYLYLIAGADERIGIKEALKRSKGRLRSLIWMSLLASLVLAGGSMLIVPGLFWAVSFSILPWVFVVEGQKGMSGLVRARQWMKGDGFRVFWYLFAFGLIVGFAPLLIQLPFQFSRSLAAQIAGGTIAGLLNLILLIPLQQAFTFALYGGLRAKKEATLQELPKQKGFFIAGAIAGLLMLPLIAFGASMIAGKAKESAMDKSRDAQRVADVRQIQTALELAYAETGRYPVQTGADLTLGEDEASRLCQLSPTETGFRDFAGADPEPPCDGEDYLRFVPADPDPAKSKAYRYLSDADGSGYRIVFELDKAVAKYAAGDNCATPAGIESVFSASSCEPVTSTSGAPARSPSPTTEPPAPSIEPTPPAEESEPATQGLVPPPDSDGDGLTDEDEIGIFATAPSEADTDGDGFGDSQEIGGLYDPKAAGAAMSDSAFDTYAERLRSKGYGITTEKTLDGTAFWKRYTAAP